MACDLCEHLNLESRIASPSDLRKAISVAAENITSGVIELVYLSDRYSSGTPFQEVAAGSSWDDIVGYYFQCVSCHQIYLLGAETYHGSGGAWRPFDPSLEGAL